VNIADPDQCNCVSGESECEKINFLIIAAAIIFGFPHTFLSPQTPEGALKPLHHPKSPSGDLGV